MKACATGDTLGMEDLFNRKEASPNDVTESKFTPMRFAIESGNPRAIELIVRKGADINWSFGQNQTSLLACAMKNRQLDIARLLLPHGACLDHISAYGWSLLLYLWIQTRVNQTSSAIFLELLSAHSSFSLQSELTDIEGWSVLHHAIAFGTPDEVSNLLRLGADPFEEMGCLH